MNNWGEIKKLAIVESDDFQDKYDRNGLEMLFYWKAKYPKFKITLFTIPNRTSDAMLNLIRPHLDWIELAIHGWDHESNYECWEWDYEKTQALIMRLTAKRYEIDIDKGYCEDCGDQHTNTESRNYYKAIFKAPGWMITGDKKGTGSGYALQSHNKLSSDNQAVYKALLDKGFLIFDRHYNKVLRPQNNNIICVDCNPDIVHMHTWDMVTGDLNGKNGFRQVEELHGVPWDQNTEFKFVSEAWDQGLFRECTGG